MRDYLVVAIIFGALPYVLTRPHLGVLLWTWVGVMNPHRLGWGFANDLPVAAIAGGVTLVSFLLSKEPKRIPWVPATIFLVLFVLWMNVTTVFALVPDLAVQQWSKVMKIQLMILLTLMLMYDRVRLHHLVWVIVISLGFYGVKGGIFTILNGGQSMVLGPEGSFISGNTEISLALTMVLPLMRYLHATSDNKWVRRGLVAAMLLTALAIIGSYSRGAFLAGGAMALFLLLKSRKKAALAAVLVLTVPLMLAMMPDKYFGKMSTIETYEQDASAMARINAWHFAFNLANHRPVLGGGLDTFTPALFQVYAPIPDNFQGAHSIYFSVLGEHGYVGLFLFLGIMLSAWRAGNRVIRQSKGRQDLLWAWELASMAQVSLVGFAVGGAFLGLAYFDVFYLLVAILVLTEAAVGKILRQEAGAPIPRWRTIGQAALAGAARRSGSGA
ncbi:MAG: putative O-glycosylation ligase, exosortase A system-associated [Sulfuricella sp.]|nr:putative O-glycosylation ligase, exosortase A system-associated [Sulfuricella sp.]